MNRRDKLLSGLDVARLQGAEIGALTSPLVGRMDGPIIYIDHASTENLKEKYKTNPEVDTTKIVTVDGVWGENTIQEAIGSNLQIDYIIASHVVEHAPDLVTWLSELTSVLKPGGSIRLAVPDKRFCFDYLRSETRLSDILTAYYNRARRPQVREVLESELYHCHIDLEAVWDGQSDKAPLLSQEQLQRAFLVSDRAKAGEYVDVHCWAFTLSSFAFIMQQLGSLGLTNLKCNRSYDIEIKDNEFIVIMSMGSQAEIAESWGKTQEEAGASVSTVLSTWPQARIAWLERGCDRLCVDDRAEIALLKRQISELRSSTSWRLTKPLRAIATRFKAR